MKIFQGMNIPKVVQKLVFGCVGYATNFPSSSGQFARCIALHLEIRREPSSWLASRQSLPRLNLEPCACTKVARSRQKICALRAGSLCSPVPLTKEQSCSFVSIHSRVAKIPTFESLSV